MSAQRFGDQLLGPDNNASHRETVLLITANEFTGASLPDVAHQYLDAFCNSSNSNGRRRWAGIALVSMMRASATVVQRLKKLSKGPSRVGHVILDCNESEERRIIAGLIIRQGLEGGIAFSDFWTSDKVLHSAPNFPRGADELWMGLFQSYLDTLSKLKLVNMTTDPMVMFPISLSASDGFRSTGRSAVAAVEQGLLTVIVSNSTLTRFHFIDLPVSHIQEVHLRQESPHESQEGQSGHRLHTLVMTLQPDHSRYLFDSSNRTTSEFKLSFSKLEDAAEFEAGIQDARQSKVTATSVVLKTSKAGNSRRSAGQHANRPPDSKQQDSLQHSGVYSDQPSDKPALAKRLGEEQRSSSNAEKEKGRLPSVSKETIRRATKAQPLHFGPPRGIQTTKGTKARAARNVAAVIESSGDEDEDENEDEELTNDEYKLRSIASVRSSSNGGTARSSRSCQRAYAEDENFVPVGSKTGSRSNKRKKDSSGTIEHTQSTSKRIRTEGNNASRPSAGSTTTFKQTDKAQESVRPSCSQGQKPTKQPEAEQNNGHSASPRHPLIGALLKSKSSSGAAAPTFKRPGQPASTPGRAKDQPVRTTPKTQTPTDVRGDLDDLPAFVHTITPRTHSTPRSQSTPRGQSTPRSQSIHDEDFGVGYTPVDTEILSSNTKKVPDSPHAESTAISGHADHEDVHREKCKGDIETAKSDPFQKQGQTVLTSFTRKLTGESLTESRTEHKEPLSAPEETQNGDCEAHELAFDLASQPLPKHSPSLFKHRTQHQTRRSFKNIPAESEMSRKVDMATTTQEAVRTLTFEVARSKHTPRSNSTLSKTQATFPNNSVHIEAGTTYHHTTEAAAQDQAQLNDSVISAPPEAVEDTLPEVLNRQAGTIDQDGEMTLIGQTNDLPEFYGGKASDLKFRSSPPVPDSSSVRENFSDASEPEPDDLSPPTSRAEEMEWEASLEPHQRNLHEQLLRTSKRVVRNIVDNETAVANIGDVFADDGERLLGLFLERQRTEFAGAFQELNSRKEDLLKQLTDASKNLKKQRKQVKDED